MSEKKTHPMYNQNAPMNLTNLLVTLHGREGKKQKFKIPDNVRLIMACKPLPITPGIGLYDMICSRSITGYKDLLEYLLIDRNTDLSLCVFEPGTVLNEMELSGGDPGRYLDNTTGDIEWLTPGDAQKGIFQLGQTFKAFNKKKERVPINYAKLSTFLSGKYRRSNLYNECVVTGDGYMAEIASNKIFKLSEMINDLLATFPGGFTILLIACRSATPYLPNKLSLQKALKLYKKFRYSTSRINLRSSTIIAPPSKKSKN
jgi:hypothetical protein